MISEGKGRVEAERREGQVVAVLWGPEEGKSLGVTAPAAAWTPPPGAWVLGHLSPRRPRRPCCPPPPANTVLEFGWPILSHWSLLPSMSCWYNGGHASVQGPIGALGHSLRMNEPPDFTRKVNGKQHFSEKKNAWESTLWKLPFALGNVY